MVQTLGVNVIKLFIYLSLTLYQQIECFSLVENFKGYNYDTPHSVEQKPPWAIQYNSQTLY